jgi:hypothetical protein
MWVLRKDLAKPPFRLNQRLSEGCNLGSRPGSPGLSAGRQYPGQVGRDHGTVERMSYHDEAAELVNRRKVQRSGLMLA